MCKKNRSVLSSIWNMKCPRCREGDLFDTGTFSFEKSFDMPDRCSHCNQNYMPEPGFYYGAMFISYIFYGWFSLLFSLALVFGFGWSVNSAFALLIFISIILFVWIFRMARSIWIHIIVKYKPSVLVK
ncbi:MAG: DUF983 domain-containing protein [Bacteroidota bacterium]